jgi:hypothetical protein
VGSSHINLIIASMENMILQDTIPADDHETSTIFAKASGNSMPREKSQSAETGRQNEVHATSSDFQAFTEVVDTHESPHTVVPPNGSMLMQELPGAEEDELSWDGYDREGIPKSLGKDTLWWPPKVGIDTHELRRTARKEVQNWRSIDAPPSNNPDHCPFCRVYFDTWNIMIQSPSVNGENPWILATPFHETMGHLKLSAFRGCPLCKYILSILRNHERKEELPGHQKEHFQFEPGTYLQMLHIKKLKAYAGVQWFLRPMNSLSSGPIMALIPFDPSLSTFPPAEYNSDGCHTLSYTEQSDQTSLELETGSLDLARRWLSDCILNHEGCLYRDRTIFPTRLLKIDLENIRLCYSSDYEDCSRYVTLSHCWGELEIFKLRKSNLSLLLQEIPYDSLCKTFRNAVEIARSLGFSWLWIDSLCIIQDDPNDWRKESARMAIVYGMSTLNIAATAAPDGRTGCLFKRDPMYTQGSRAVVKIDDKQQILDAVDIFLASDNTTETPLSKRAWALQERLLASRTLYFGVSQLFWDCATKFACDRYPNHLSQFFAMGHIPDIELYKSWGRIVEIYSKGHLAHQSDRTVAISGIAQSIRNNTGDEYLAGLWRKELERHLCWWAETPLASLELQLAGMPSWSGFAIPGPIHMKSDELSKYYIEVVDVIIMFEGSPTFDPFSCMDGGALTIRTKHILHCTVHHETHSNRLNKVGILVAGRKEFANVFMDYEEYRISDQACVLVLIGTFYRERWGRDIARHFGLLLKRTPKNGQYKRAGAFDFDTDNIESDDFLLQDLFKRAEAPTYTPIESDYEAVTVENGETWYTITII